MGGKRKRQVSQHSQGEQRVTKKRTSGHVCETERGGGGTHRHPRTHKEPGLGGGGGEMAWVTERQDSQGGGGEEARKRREGTSQGTCYAADRSSSSSSDSPGSDSVR